jgi:hypothetical protein
MASCQKHSCWHFSASSLCSWYLQSVYDVKLDQSGPSFNDPCLYFNMHMNTQYDRYWRTNIRLASHAQSSTAFSSYCVWVLGLLCGFVAPDVGTLAPHLTLNLEDKGLTSSIPIDLPGMGDYQELMLPPTWLSRSLECADLPTTIKAKFHSLRKITPLIRPEYEVDCGPSVLMQIQLIRRILSAHAVCGPVT